MCFRKNNVEWTCGHDDTLLIWLKPGFFDHQQISTRLEATYFEFAVLVGCCLLHRRRIALNYHGNIRQRSARCVRNTAVNGALGSLRLNGDVCRGGPKQKKKNTEAERPQHVPRNFCYAPKQRNSSILDSKIFSHYFREQHRARHWESDLRRRSRRPSPSNMIRRGCIPANLNRS